MQLPRAKETAKSRQGGYEEQSGRKMKAPASLSSKLRITVDEFRDGRNARVWWAVFGVVVIAAFSTRLYKLNQPDHVCWDEAHFGKYANYYLNRSFFFDVHPPLGKMLIALFGYLDGYNASFAFDKPGDKFEDHRYLGMRFGCATMGALLVPLTFLTVWEMTSSLPASTFAAALNLFDTGMITLNRFILLDPPMLFFIAASVYAMVKFNNIKEKRAFTGQWWFWLSTIGVLLACTVSVKFVGVFAVILVGLRAIVDLWDVLGDMSRPVSYTVKHFMARVLCLIILPAVLYIGIFYVHLTVLNHTGPGDGFYSSAFQISLEGNDLRSGSSPKEVAYGAVVTIKSRVTSGGYLHSHAHFYPAGVSGAGQQQVTSYGHKDSNNEWHLKRYNRMAPSWNSTRPIDYVRNGDYMRLEHIETGRNLHAHQSLSPITAKHFQVTAYGEEGIGDTNDYWRLEIEGGEEKEILETMRHPFRLIHHNLGCALTLTKKQYPQWGFEQEEVSCNPNTKQADSLWNVEENRYPRLPNVSFINFELPFYQRFIESHVVMITGNAGLKPKEGELTSRPWMWPINLQGNWFSPVKPVVYLIGNPIIWWGNILLLAVFLVLFVVAAVYGKRKITVSPRQKALQQRTVNASVWLLIGWLLHYLPFWSMARVLYFHHYFPAVLFASMISGIILDYLFETVSGLFKPQYSSQSYILISLTTLFILLKSFYMFAPLTYGSWPSTPDEPRNVTFGHIGWLRTWEFANP